MVMDVMVSCLFGGDSKEDVEWDYCKNLKTRVDK